MSSARMTTMLGRLTSAPRAKPTNSSTSSKGTSNCMPADLTANSRNRQVPELDRHSDLLDQRRHRPDHLHRLPRRRRRPAAPAVKPDLVFQVVPVPPAATAAVLPCAAVGVHQPDGLLER